MSTLLLGGIVNILNQHDLIEALEDKVNSLEIDNQTNKTRIESIENWLLKQDKNLQYMTKKLSTNSNNSNHDDTSKECENLQNEMEKKRAFETKCNECDKTFYRN